MKALAIVLFLYAGAACAAPPARWDSRGVGAGGATFSPSISPFDSNEIYLACDMSDLFHTTNAGAAWSTLDFNQIEAFHNTEVQFTSDPFVLYALDYHQLGGLGAFVQTPTKSVDGGQTWTRLSSASWPYGLAYRVIADPQSTNRLIVSTFSNVYFSADGGSNFALVASAITNRVAGACFDGTNVFIACRNGLLVSSDGGATFTDSALGGIPANTAFYSFVGAKQGGVTRFYCVETPLAYASPDQYPVTNMLNFVYTLDWGQPNWIALTNGITANDLPMLVGMARSDVSTAYVVLMKRPGTSPYPDISEVFKTTDQGTNWQSVFTISNNFNINTGWGGVPPVTSTDGDEPRGFIVDPNNANRAIKTDGLSYMTTNGGLTWQALYVPASERNPTNTLISRAKAYHGVGMEPTVCYWMTWNSPTNQFAAFSDIKMIRSKDGGASWSYDYTGFSNNKDVHLILQHPATNILYAINTFLQSPYLLAGIGDASIDSAAGYIAFSTNSGQTWSNMANFGVSPTWMAIDPTNANTMYVSTAHSVSGGIWRTTNLLNGAAASWQILAAHPRTRGHPYNIRILNDGTLACTYGAGVTPSSRFTSSSGVFLCTNVAAAVAGDTNAWVDRSTTNMGYWTQDLVIDPFDAGQSNWFVGVWNAFGLATNGYPNPFGPGGLYATTNRGVAWTKIFTNDAVTSCTFNPCNSNEVYIATRFSGLWYTPDIHAGTPTFLSVTNYPHRQPLRIFFNPYNSNEVWVTSNGNGLRVGTLTPGSLQFSAPTFSVDESGTNAVLTVTRSGGSDNPVTVGFGTSNGTATAELDYSATNGVLAWADGDTNSQAITVPILNRSGAQGSRSFTVSLSDATVAALGSPSNAVVTITDAGLAGSLQLGASFTSVIENAGTVPLTVTRTGGSFGVASVNYATQDGTANAGTDYTATHSTLTWADGDSDSKILTVAILNRSGVQGSRAFTVNLNGVSGAALGSTTSAVVTITDHTPIPEPPGGVTASDGTFVDKVQVAWNSGTDATRYSVWRSATNDSGTAALVADEITATNYNDTHAVPGVLYYYWLKATNVSGASAFSSSDSGWRASVSPGVCADYDGDGKADPAIYDETTGTWKVKLSSANYYLLITTLNGLGGPGFSSVSADYDGDSKADPAVYQEATGLWKILLSSADYALVTMSQPLGGPGYSGMPADYDGDGKADPGVYQRARGDWKVLLSSAGHNSVEVLGLLGGTGYRAVAADYDGDKKADPAVYGEATGDWKVMLSGADYWKYDSSVYGWSLGGAGYIPVPADYDGDGKADPAVRSATGNEWIVMFSSGGYTPVPLKISFEQAFPSAKCCL